MTRVTLLCPCKQGVVAFALIYFKLCFTSSLQDLQLPLPTPVSNPDQVISEIVKNFWLVDDIYTFENMGFSLTVDKRKYLACPECEFGPLGFFEIDSNKSFVSIDRVKEESSE